MNGWMDGVFELAGRAKDYEQAPVRVIVMQLCQIIFPGVTT